MNDLHNKTFTNLKAIGVHEIKRYKSARNEQTKVYWVCECACGNTKIVRGEHLVSERTISCGCLAKDNALKHGHAKRDEYSPEYRSWLSMRGRVANPVKNHEFYSNIKICKRWDKFENFLKDMGAKPTTKHSIDRINPFGDYTPKNCRWATSSEQMQNQRRNYELWDTYKRFINPVPWRIFQQRVRILGWSPEKAAFTPKMKNQFG